MAKEVIWISIEAEIDKQSFNQAKDDIKWFNKRIESETAINLSISVANLKQQLANIKQQIKKANVSWDTKLEIELTATQERLKQQLTQATRELRNFARTWEKDVSVLGKNFESVNQNIWKMWNTLRWLSWILWSFFSIWKLTWVSDTFNSMQNALRQVAEWDELDILQQKILKVANNARVPVDSLTKSFVRFDLINKQLWGTQEETLTILDSLSKWLTLSWATAEESSSAVLQLSQAFWSWVLQWDEFRSVAENLPMVLDILAKKLWVPRWELKNLASDWLITSQVLKEALIEANDEITEKFENSQKTIWQALTQIKNDFLITFWDLDKEWEVTSWIVSGIDFIKNALLSFIQLFPWFTWLAWWLTIALVWIWWALTVLWWPITITIWLIAWLVIWIWSLISIVSETQIKLWDLQTKLEENKKAQDDLKKSYDEWKISLEEYQKKSAELIWVQEDLKKKNEELSSSFWYFFTKLVAWVKSAFNIFVWVVWTSIVFVWELVWNSLKFIFENLKLIPENFGIAFNNIPWAIEYWLKQALKLVWAFIDKITLWLWWIISDKLWIWKIIDDFNVFWSKQLNFKAVWISSKDFVFTKKAIQELTKEYENFWKVEAKNPIKNWGWGGWWWWGWNDSWWGGWWWNSKTKKQIEEEKKQIEEAQKKQVEMLERNRVYKQKLRDEEIKKEEEKNKKLKSNLDALSDAYKEWWDIYGDVIDEAKDKSDEFSDKIKDLQEDIKDLNKDLADLESEKVKTLWERFVETSDKIKDLNKEIKDLKDSWINENIAQSIWLDTLRLMQSDSEIAWWKVSDVIKLLELQKELNDLKNEQLLIQQNITDSQITETQRVAWLSETAKYLEENKIKKQNIQEEFLLKQWLSEQEIQDEIKKQWTLDEVVKNFQANQLLNLQTQKDAETKIIEDFNNKKAQLDENYKNKVEEIENQITDKTLLETNKRISYLEALRLKALETAEAMRQAWASSSWDWTWSDTNSTTSVWNIIINSNQNPKVIANEVQKAIVNANKNANKWSY